MAKNNQIPSQNEETNMNGNKDLHETVNPANEVPAIDSQNSVTGEIRNTPAVNPVDLQTALPIERVDTQNSWSSKKESTNIMQYEAVPANDEETLIIETDTKSPRVKRIGAAKVAQTQVNRLRKETKLKRLKKELKELRSAIKRGYMIKKRVEKITGPDGKVTIKETQKNQFLDSASKVLIQNKCVQKEVEIFDLQEILKNLKREVKRKARTNLHANRHSFAKRRKEVGRMNLINKYKGWLELASKNGGRSILSEAYALSQQGKNDEAYAKLLSSLTSIRAKNFPKAKSRLEFDEDMGRELLNFLSKSF